MNRNAHLDLIRLAYHKKAKTDLPKPVGVKQLVEVYHITFMNGKKDIDHIHPDTLGYDKGDTEGLSNLVTSNRRIRKTLNKLFQQVKQDKSDLQLTKTIQSLNNQILISLWLMGYDYGLRRRMHRLRKKANLKDLDNKGLIDAWQTTYRPDWVIYPKGELAIHASKLKDSINQRFYLSYKKALVQKGKVEVADDDLERIGSHLSSLINQFNKMYKDVTSAKVRTLCLKIASELYSYLWWVVVSDINEHGEAHELDPAYDAEKLYL